jgi:hypothetical protein
MIYIPENQARTSSRLGNNISVSKCVISFVDSLYGTMITIKFLCWTGKRVLKKLKCTHTVNHHCHHHHHHLCVMFLSSFICLTCHHHHHHHHHICVMFLSSFMSNLSSSSSSSLCHVSELFYMSNLSSSSSS